MNGSLSDVGGALRSHATNFKKSRRRSNPKRRISCLLNRGPVPRSSTSLMLPYQALPAFFKSQSLPFSASPFSESGRPSSKGLSHFLLSFFAAAISSWLGRKTFAAPPRPTWVLDSDSRRGGLWYDLLAVLEPRIWSLRTTRGGLTQ
jgi:hypothetical protein